MSANDEFTSDTPLLRHLSREWAREMQILGLNAYAHDAGVALVVDGQPVFALEEERLSRVRHTSAFPRLGLQHLQDHFGLRLDDVDQIVLPWHPPSIVAMGARMVFGQFPPALRMLGRAASPVANFPAAVKLIRAAEDVASAFGTDRKPRVHYIPHHHAHACNAFYLSPFDRAAVLIMDGYGDECSTSWHFADRQGVRLLRKNHPLESIGILYAIISMHLGYRVVFDEGKVMALAAHGTDALLSRFERLVDLLPDGQYRIDHKFFSFRRFGHARPFKRAFLEQFGQTRNPWEPIAQHHMDLAYALQRVTERTVVHVARGLHAVSGATDLCFGGGVALNCIANDLLSRDTGFQRVHIAHSPSDCGIALGAALSRARLIEPELEDGCMPVPDSPFLGPEYSRDEYRAALGVNSIAYTEPPDVVEATARLLAGGACIGWFQGRAEYGPRSLGNRSILADPRDGALANRLNESIKQREWFRPFGPTVLAERAAEVFEIRSPSPNMSFAVKVRPERRNDIPGVMSRDGLARVHTLTSEQNPLFYRLIEAFYRETGIPMLINTSFNVNEPTVCTPSAAVTTWMGSGLDALVMGDFVAERKSL